MCGLTVGVCAAGLLDHAPWPVRLLLIPVMGGAALLPDIDHPSSRVARSLGFVTKFIAVGVAALSLAVYHATRTEADVANRHSGHRTLTHTVPGSLFFGLIAGVTVLAHPIAGAVFLALLIGLMARGFKTVGTGFTLAGGGLAWFTLTHYPGWWWLWPSVVTLGSLTHIAGDWVTNSGVPIYWPLLRDDRRWSLHHAPMTFATGKDFETEVVTPVLAVSLTLAGGFAAGLPQLVLHSWAVAHGH
jgi:membrane-bound metal-dependent hydrolase YbcI (DUF457 family)